MAEVVSPAKRFHALTAERKRAVHFCLCERALETWREYCSKRWWIVYGESVCGTFHIVDKKLPERALATMLSGRILD